MFVKHGVEREMESDSSYAYLTQIPEKGKKKSNFLSTYMHKEQFECAVVGPSYGGAERALAMKQTTQNLAA